MNEREKLTPKKVFEIITKLYPDLTHVERSPLVKNGFYLVRGRVTEDTDYLGKINIEWGDLTRYPPKKYSRRHLEAKDLPPAIVIRNKKWSPNARALCTCINDKGFYFYKGSEHEVRFDADHKELIEYEWSPVDVTDWQEFFLE